MRIKLSNSWQTDFLKSLIFNLYSLNVDCKTVYKFDCGEIVVSMTVWRNLKISIITEIFKKKKKRGRKKQTKKTKQQQQTNKKYLSLL